MIGLVARALRIERKEEGQSEGRYEDGRKLVLRIRPRFVLLSRSRPVWMHSQCGQTEDQIPCRYVESREYVNGQSNRALQ